MFTGSALPGQQTRHDSDLPEQLIAIWFKRLNALTTSIRADLRHAAIQMLAVSIPTCLPVTFCDHAVAWMNSLLKHAFKVRWSPCPARSALGVGS
jgi:hypothetical protein